MMRKWMPEHREISYIVRALKMLETKFSVTWKKKNKGEVCNLFLHFFMPVISVLTKTVTM
jgi:hypothetical protein